ncbi:MAG: hypothetical protein ACI4AI_02090 [Paludibacteraceae bacterium]
MQPKVAKTFMTNNDFWKHIETIIAQGFDAHGLKQLEEYAELFISGRLVYQRFSPLEQHGCAAGGSNHVIASLLAGAGIDPSSLSAPEDSFQRERECAETQANRIAQWAKTVGCWIDNVDKSLPSLLGEQIAEGGEAHVYYKGNTLVKSIGLDYYILPVLALDRISLHNAYFPETRLNVLGFGRTSDGDFQVIVEQPHIQGEQMSDEEIQQFAERMGFELRNPRNWTYTTPEIYLSDLHDENVIKSVNGNVFVIDCDIRINTPELKLGGVRQLTTEVEFISE